MEFTLRLPERFSLEAVKRCGQPFERCLDNPTDTPVLSWFNPKVVNWEEEALVAVVEWRRMYYYDDNGKVFSGSSHKAFNCSTKLGFHLICQAVSIGVFRSITFYRVDLELAKESDIPSSEVVGLTTERSEPVSDAEIDPNALHPWRLKRDDTSTPTMVSTGTEFVSILEKPEGQKWTKEDVSKLNAAKVAVETMSHMPHRLVALNRPWRKRTFHEVLREPSESFKVRVVGYFRRWDSQDSE